MATAKKAPPQEEWDFRAIPTKELFAATKYEYFRSSHKCGAVDAWLNQPVPMVFGSQAIKLAKMYPDQFLPGKTIREALATAHCLPEAPRFLPKGEMGPLGPFTASRSHFTMVSRHAAESALGSEELARIVTWIPEFPKPWQGVGASPSREEYVSQAPPNYIPAVTVLPREAYLLSKTPRPDEVQGLWRVTLSINVQRNIEDLVRDFIGVVDDLGGPKPAERGRKARLTFLKYLSAYRLHHAGVKLEDTASLFKQSDGGCSGGIGTAVVPDYASRQRWKKAVAEAAAWLSEDFLTIIEDEFLGG